MRSSRIPVMVLVVVCASFAAAKSNEKVIFSFNQTDGSLADSGLITDKQGNFYGTTFEGGGFGNVFELSPTKSGGWKETVLHNFTGSDGALPVSSLVFDDAGNLYGTAQAGGQEKCTNTGLGCGVAFELSPGKGEWKYTVLYYFVPGQTKGVMPVGGLVVDKKGNLYGTTWAPGIQGGPLYLNKNSRYRNTFWGCDEAGCGGTVFKLTHTNNGWKETDVYAFTGGSDGSSPQANLIFDSAGNLYGTTPYGGTTGCYSGYGCGVVFKVTLGKSKAKESVLYSFTGASDGGYPLGSLLFDAAGNLYSTGSIGGDVNECQQLNNGCGTVFELTPSSGKWTQKVLYTFKGGTDGAYPYATVISDKHGNLYGTTQTAGDPTSPSGVVFKLVHSGGDWTEKVLHAFSYGSGDGQSPIAPLIFGPGGLLYGTTQAGGVSGLYGSIFTVTP